MLKTARFAALAVALIGLAACASQQQPKVPVAESAQQEESLRFIGLRIRDNDVGLIIEALDCQGPAYLAGLRKDDIIVALEGRSMRMREDNQDPGPGAIVRDYVINRDNRQVPLIVEHEGRLYQTSIEIWEYEEPPKYNC